MISYAFHNSQLLRNSYRVYIITHTLWQTFCIALDFLLLGFWTRIMLLQDWSHLYIYSRHHGLVDSNAVSICTMKTRRVFLGKAEEVYPTGEPGPCSQVLVESALLIYFCYFVCFIWLFYVLCSVCLFSMSGLYPWITLFWFPLELGSPDYSLHKYPIFITTD